MTIESGAVAEGMLLQSPVGPVIFAPQGLGLRDQFAITALLVVTPYMLQDAQSPDEIATKAYELADAMLRTREVKP